MKPKPIGIVGGAGPMAGAALLSRLLALSSSAYGCYKDADFPKVVLISFPFSDMLSPNRNVSQVRQELSDCLQQLRQDGAAVLAIACNTLHAFLDEHEERSDLVHLPKAISKEIPPSEMPLVLCTSTSAQYGLHQRYFPCCYPHSSIQEKIDAIIEQILRGVASEVIAPVLRQTIETQIQRTIILGCTELSLFSKQLEGMNKLIIDPAEVAVKQILEKSFGGNP